MFLDSYLQKYKIILNILILLTLFNNILPAKYEMVVGGTYIAIIINLNKLYLS